MSTLNPVFTKFYRDKLEGILADNINIGDGAGSTNQGQDAVAIGALAGNTNQGEGAMSLGYHAGQTEQDLYAVAVGYNAGNSNQGNSSVAIGFDAGNTNQKTNCVAIGSSAGKTTQLDGAIGIGFYAGSVNQKGGAVAIGMLPGASNQGDWGIAIGGEAGKTDQSDYAIAIGRNAGKTNQGLDSIAIGVNAATTNQHDNTIVLNAAGTALETEGTNKLYVDPLAGPLLRKDPVSGNVGRMLAYDLTTKEIFSTSSTDVISFANVTGVSDAAILIPIDQYTKHIRVCLDKVVIATTNQKIAITGRTGASTYWFTNPKGMITSQTASSNAMANSVFDGTVGYVPLSVANITNSALTTATIDFHEIYSGGPWTVTGQIYIDTTDDVFCNVSGRIAPEVNGAELNYISISKSVSGGWTSGYITVYQW